jgi:hypothetical protein
MRDCRDLQREYVFICQADEESPVFMQQSQALFGT